MKNGYQNLTKTLLVGLLVASSFFYSGLAKADTATITKICGIYRDDNFQNCSYNSLLAAHTIAIHRAAFSITMPAYSGTLSAVTLHLGTSTDGGSCQNYGCNPVDLVQYSAPVDSTITWSNQPSSIVLDTQTPANNAAPLDFNISMTLSSNTTYYFGIRAHNESALSEGYWNGSTGSYLSYTVTPNNSGNSTSTPDATSETQQLYYIETTLLVLTALSLVDLVRRMFTKKSL